MDYEQRYKEALDEAKAIHEAIRKDLKPIIEQIFPELKESKEENPSNLNKGECVFAFKEDENGVIKFVYEKN